MGTGPAEALVALVALAILVALPFYIRSLRRALARCSTASRTMPPDKVWLLLIPIFNLVWHASVVSNLAKSLGREFKSRGLANADPEPGRSVGLAMCLLSVGIVVPVIGVALEVAGAVCWIVYWIKVEGYSQALRSPSDPEILAYRSAEPQPRYLLIGIAGLAAFLFIPLIGTAVWLGINGAKEPEATYVTVAELRPGHNQLLGKRIRVVGDVEEGSIRRVGNTVEFVLVFEGQKLKVSYTGTDPLPDAFIDGTRACADGKLDQDQVLLASRVQAKCAVR
jgi:cytochrome c-type biogenesis protein CcmE